MTETQRCNVAPARSSLRGKELHNTYVSSPNTLDGISLRNTWFRKPQGARHVAVVEEDEIDSVEWPVLGGAEVSSHAVWPALSKTPEVVASPLASARSETCPAPQSSDTQDKTRRNSRLAGVSGHAAVPGPETQSSESQDKARRNARQVGVSGHVAMPAAPDPTLPSAPHVQLEYTQATCNVRDIV